MKYIRTLKSGGKKLAGIEIDEFLEDRIESEPSSANKNTMCSSPCSSTNTNRHSDITTT